MKGRKLAQKTHSGKGFPNSFAISKELVIVLNKLCKRDNSLILSRRMKQLASAITALNVRSIVDHIVYGVID
jgi:hypothetical protein